MLDISGENPYDHASLLGWPCKASWNQLFRFNGDCSLSAMQPDVIIASEAPPPQTSKARKIDKTSSEAISRISSRSLMATKITSSVWKPPRIACRTRYRCSCIRSLSGTAGSCRTVSSKRHRTRINHRGVGTALRPFTSKRREMEAVLVGQKELAIQRRFVYMFREYTYKGMERTQAQQSRTSNQMASDLSSPIGNP